MTIKVKFFAKLREDIGVDECQIEHDIDMTIANVWHKAAQQNPPEFLLCARNFEYVDFNEIVQDGDEIAFFPPVTGG